MNTNRKCKLYYKILPEINLMVEYWSGQISLNDYLFFKINFSQDPLYNPSYKLIINRTDSTLELKTTELNKLRNYLKQNNFILTNNKSVHITNTPEQVVQSTIFEIVKNYNSEKLKIVSTLEAAFQFLGLNYEDFQLIENIYNKLKHTEDYSLKCVYNKDTANNNTLKSFSYF